MLKRFIHKQQKLEFEGRVLISLINVTVIALASFLFFKESSSIMAILGNWLGLSTEISDTIGYSVIICLLIIASLLRMWAGSVLSSDRVMAFKIQHDQFFFEGPYRLSRNPIYLADFIAFTGFALCLKPVGIILPIIQYFHYNQLINYEEQILAKRFDESYYRYSRNVPEFFPNFNGIQKTFSSKKEFKINYDGFRNNAQYILFIPGFLVSAITGSLLTGIIIGLPAVIDWAVIHTIKGIKSNNNSPDNKSTGIRKERILQNNVFSDIVYAQCWEDPQIDRKAFRISENDIVFSITSGGCNVLSFLIDNPKEIIALDLNPFQNYLLDLKMAAFKGLDYNNMLSFLGVTSSPNRRQMYNSIRQYLQKESLIYWDKQHGKIEAGIIHCGRYEKYMRMLQYWLKVLVGSKLPGELFQAVTQEEREILYARKWDNWRYKLFTRIFLSRAVMTMLFTGAFFKQLDQSFSFGAHFREKIRLAVTDLPLKDNYFFSYILLGNYYSSENLPSYLRKENFEIIKSRIDRIRIIENSCENFFASMPANTISKFNFTNIFEWMSPGEFESLLKETIRVAKNKAILTYRNLLVPRSRPESLSQWIEPLPELASALQRTDLSFIYKRYVVETVIK